MRVRNLRNNNHHWPYWRLTPQKDGYFLDRHVLNEEISHPGIK